MFTTQPVKFFRIDERSVESIVIPKRGLILVIRQI